MAVTLATACDRPEPIAFEMALWPGEGVPRFESTGAPLVLREAPSASAPVARVVEDLAAGTPIAFDETRYRTLEPGHIAVIAPDTVRGRALGDLRQLSRDDYYSGGFPEGAWGVAPGDTIEYLQYRAEGTCFVRIGGTVVDANPCPTYVEPAFELADEPRVAWWIRVQLDDAPAGWLLVGDSAVAEVGRGF